MAEIGSMTVIDKSDGTVHAADLSLGPRLAREAFLASPQAKDARAGVQNPPWCAWVIDALEIDGVTFRAMVCFYYEQFGMLELMMITDELPYGGYTPNEATERARDEAHASWLDERVGPPESSDDEGRTYRLGRCEIVVRYDKRLGAATMHFRHDWEQDDGIEP